MLRSSRFIELIVGAIVVLTALKIFNIVAIEGGDVLVALLILVGILIVQYYFGEGIAAPIFFGSVIFFIGVLLFLIQNFLFDNDSTLLWTSIPFILGFSFLIVFIDQRHKKKYLFVALPLIICGFLVLLHFGTLNAATIFSSFVFIVKDYYILLIVGVAILVLISKR